MESYKERYFQARIQTDTILWYMQTLDTTRVIPNKWESVWDHIWRTGASGRIISAGREVYNVLLRRMLLRFLSQESRLLELGCGTSTLTLSLTPHIKELIGLDISGGGR